MQNESINIRCGFYSGHFDWDDDFEKFATLRQEVGMGGRCLKPGRD
jgi:hypothetical protein